MKTEKKLPQVHFWRFAPLFGALQRACNRMSKTAKTGDALPEVRNNGTAIQWKYSDEADWHDLCGAYRAWGAAGEKTGQTVKTVKTARRSKNAINGTKR